MKDKKRKWTLTYGGIFLLIGVTIGQLFIYVTQGDFSTGSIVGALPITFILIIVNIIQVKRKNDKTPELDERIEKNILKFCTYSAHVFIGLLFISLAVIEIMDVKSISLTYLWIIIFSYMIFIGIGTLIVKRQ